MVSIGTKLNPSFVPEKIVIVGRRGGGGLYKVAEVLKNSFGIMEVREDGGFVLWEVLEIGFNGVFIHLYGGLY